MGLSILGSAEDVKRHQGLHSGGALTDKPEGLGLGGLGGASTWRKGHLSCLHKDAV